MKTILRLCVFLLMSLAAFAAKAQGLSIFTDLLYWHASEATSAFWSEALSSPAPQVTEFAPQPTNFNTAPALRVGFSYEPMSNTLDSKFYWTHYSTKSDSHYSFDGALLLPEFFSGFLSGDCFGASPLGNCFFSGKVHWQLQMNQVDLEVGHKFTVGHSISIHPTVGIRAATINQTVHAKWDEILFISNEKVVNDFTGIGPSFGIDAKWNFYKQLSLLSDFSTAFMWGSWHVKDNYQSPSALFGLIPPTDITSSMNHAQLGTAMLDYFLGLEWAYIGRSQVNFKLGYEMQYWPNQQRMTIFQQLPTHGDLTLQGLTCGLTINL